MFKNIKQTKKNKFIFVFVIIIFIVIFFSFKNLNNISFNLEKKSEFSIKEDEHIIEDSLKRKVKVKKNPERIAAIFSPAVHTIAILGGSEKIQSVSSGNMRDKLLLDIYPSISKARTPKGGGQFNIEELMKKPTPDLIIVDAETVNNKKLMKKIDRFNVPVIALDFKNIEEQKKAILMIGKVLNNEDKAKQFNDEIDSTLKEIEDKIKTKNKKNRRTLYHAVNELLRGDIKDTVPAEIINRLNIDHKGVSDLKGFNRAKNYISLEQLFSFDPDYIIINGEDVFDYINENTRLHSLKAYKENNIYNIPVAISRWGQPNSIETVLFSKWLAKTIYPEEFSELDIKNETKIFYKKYTNVDLDEKTLENILSGRNIREILEKNKN